MNTSGYQPVLLCVVVLNIGERLFLMDSNLDRSPKSDTKLATIKGARQAGVPLTKSSASYRMDFGEVLLAYDWETSAKMSLS